jgi:hypothetical protein
LRKVLRRTKAVFNTSNIPKDDGAEMFEAVCKLGLEGIVSKRPDAPYRSGPSKSWIKVKNPKAPAATRILDGCPYRKSNPHVLMVQSTKHRSHFDAPGALNVPANGRILAQG